MPNMTDPYFSKSVIFICEYNNDGAIGFIIIKPVNTMKIISSGIKDKFFKDKKKFKIIHWAKNMKICALRALLAIRIHRKKFMTILIRKGS